MKKPYIPTGYLTVAVKVTCPCCIEPIDVSDQVLNIGIELNELLSKTITVSCNECGKEFKFKLDN